MLQVLDSLLVLLLFPWAPRAKGQLCVCPGPRQGRGCHVTNRSAGWPLGSSGFYSQFHRTLSG